MSNSNKQLNSSGSGKRKKKSQPCGPASVAIGGADESRVQSGNSGSGQHSSLSSMRSDPAGSSSPRLGGERAGGVSPRMARSSEASMHDEKVGF